MCQSAVQRKDGGWLLQSQELGQAAQRKCPSEFEMSNVPAETGGEGIPGRGTTLPEDWTYLWCRATLRDLPVTPPLCFAGLQSLSPARLLLPGPHPCALGLSPRGQGAARIAASLL